MSCARYRGLLSRYVDGEVTARQRGELLGHIEGCPECSAWLAKARQADVLLKNGVPALRPSDRVRETVLGAVKQEAVPRRRPSALGRIRMFFSEILLRLDPSPRHYVMALIIFMSALTGVAYWQGFVPWGVYDQMGFLVQDGAEKERVDATPLPAMSRGAYGVGGPVAVPNLEDLKPADGSREVDLAATLGARFDQPMDRSSVERAWLIEPPLGGQFVWDADNSVRFTPKAPLLRGVKYTLTLTGTARSLYGIPLAKPIQWSFQTRDPYRVTIEPEVVGSIAATTVFTLHFETPMSREGVKVALHSSSQEGDFPAALQWDEGNETLTVAPGAPMPPGEIRLWVGADSMVQNGETLGRAYEAGYVVDAPLPRLRFTGERVQVSRANDLYYLRYEAVLNAAGALPPSLTLDFYALPIEKLAALGPQARERAWPSPLSPQARDGLTLVRTIYQSYDEIVSSERKVKVPGLTPGAYLVVATAPGRDSLLQDWQTLIVTDSSIAHVEDGSLWATNSAGQAWQGGEILLFRPDGSLLASGQANEQGVWIPTVEQKGATLAVVRGAEQNIAAAVWEPSMPTLAGTTGTLEATLQTDRPIYAPGWPVNFRVGLRLPTPLPVAPLQPTGEAPTVFAPPSELHVSLLHLNGATLSTLTLTTDEVGGASGAFTLSAMARQGQYTVRVQSGAKSREFPLYVTTPQRDSLSVMILPERPEEEGGQAITRTVSVLGPGGEPVVGAALTGTLDLLGEGWVSEPVTATTDGAGRATLVTALPTWARDRTDPSLALQVRAHKSELSGSDRQYIDHLPVVLRKDTERHLLSPSLNLAAVVRRSADSSIELRLEPLSVEDIETREMLLLARGPSGDALRQTLQVSSAVTVTLPAAFRGGVILLRRAGVEASRETELPPPTQDALTIETAVNVQPGAPLTVTAALADSDGISGAGIAALWFRRVSEHSSLTATYGWEPGVRLLGNEPTTVVLTAPSEPGLWYVVSEASGVGGERGWAQRVVRVMPGPAVQLPPTQQARIGESGRVSIVVHNQGDRRLSSGLLAGAGPDLQLVGNASQPVDVSAGEWQRLDWRYTTLSEGEGQLFFTFMPSAKVAGTWSVEVSAPASERVRVTYTAGGVTADERVGVQVPSGLEADAVRLEIRASSQLLPTLATIAAGSFGTDVTDSVARLGSLAGVYSVYSEVGAPKPDGLMPNAPQRAAVLDMLYGAQGTDGGWGDVSRSTMVLLSLKREAVAGDNIVSGQRSSVEVSAQVIGRGLEYLKIESRRPVETVTENLDQRAYLLYTLALYGSLSTDEARPLMEYAQLNLGDKGLSRAGQAWLALALLYTGDQVSSLTLLERLIASNSRGDAQAAAPILELLLTAELGATWDAAERNALAQANVKLLMNSRRGSGWATGRETADAVWALSRYAAMTGERPTSAAPTLTLNGRDIAADGLGGSVQVALTGSALDAGTNWLELRPAAPGQSLYYSLTLRAAR